MSPSGAREWIGIPGLYSPPTSRTDPRVQTLRELFRNLLALRSLAESDGVRDITGPNGIELSLEDIEYLYQRAMRRPMQVRPTNVSAESLQRGECFIQHGGQWREITYVKPERSLVHVFVTLPSDQVKHKRFPLTATVPMITLLQKKALDRDRLHPCLPKRQQQAIELFLVLNQPEESVAVAMGLAPTNPIGMYATAGLERLLQLMDKGLLDRVIDPNYLMAL